MTLDTLWLILLGIIFNPLIVTMALEVRTQPVRPLNWARTLFSQEQVRCLVESYREPYSAARDPHQSFMVLTNPPLAWSSVTDMWIQYLGAVLTCHYLCARPGRSALSDEDEQPKDFWSRVRSWDWAACEEEFRMWQGPSSPRYRGLAEYVDGNSAVTLKPLAEFLRDTSKPAVHSWEVLLSLGPSLRSQVPKVHSQTQ